MLKFIEEAWSKNLHIWIVPSIHSLNCASEPTVVEMKSYGNCISKQQIILCISELEIISITSYSIPSKFTTHCQSLQFAWFCYFRYNHKLYSLALFLQLCRLYHQLALICSLVAQLRIATEKLHWLYVWRWSLQQEVLLLESSDISICSAWGEKKTNNWLSAYVA